MKDGEKIVQAALKWLGTPHVNQAKVRGKGVDCGMLLVAATEDAGLIKRDSISVTPYSNEWHLHRSEEMFLKYIKKYCTKIDAAQMEPGDFLMYQFGRCQSHAAIYIGKSCVIHAAVDKGVILSNIGEMMFYDAKGRPRLRGIYRYKGVAR